MNKNSINRYWRISSSFWRREIFRAEMINTLATFNLFLVVATVVSTFSGFPMYYCDDHMNVEKKIYCSTNLSATLELVCGGRYYSFSNKYPESIGGSIAPRMFQDSALLSKLVSEDYGKPLPPNGSIHECCRRPCGYSELKLYCAN